MKNRIVTLDWLRGIMAIFIMIYHLSSWYFIKSDSSMLLGRIGLYGVTVFFIISGLSMALVYSKYINSFTTIFTYFVRRIFRIWPLMWLCVGLVVMENYVKSGNIDGWLIINNITTVFAFIDHDGYLCTGAWSVGNEIVYYTLTPIFIYTYNLNIKLGNLMLFFIFIISCIYSGLVISPNLSLGNQWNAYIHPLNNLFFYVSGISFFYNFSQLNLKRSVTVFIILIASLIFILYPVSGDLVFLIQGSNRLVFSLASLLLVFGFYKLYFNDKNNLISKIFEEFGVWSYGIYLFHPIVYLYLNHSFYFNKVENIYKSIIIVLITFLISVISFYLFEKKFIKLGKNLTDNSANI
ncbi:MAG: acyltransferase [Paludibacter sp.]|nr:acyltransferase [Paludibacter sp.]